MSILYSLVTSGANVLAKHSVCEGNFNEIVDKLLEKIPCTDDKKTYYHGKYLFHYIVETKCVYLCITDKTCQRSRAFLFLNEIKRKLSQDKNYDFSKTLAKEMYRYGEDYANIVVRSGELDELNNISVENSEAVLGEKLLIVKYNPSETIQYPNIINITSTPSNPCIERQLKPTSNLLKLMCATIAFIGIIYVINSMVSFSTPVVVVLFVYFISKWKNKE